MTGREGGEEGLPQTLWVGDHWTKTRQGLHITLMCVRMIPLGGARATEEPESALQILGSWPECDWMPVMKTRVTIIGS